MVEACSAERAEAWNKQQETLLQRRAAAIRRAACPVLIQGQEEGDDGSDCMGVYDPMPRSSTGYGGAGGGDGAGDGDGDDDGDGASAGGLKMVNGRPVYRLRGESSGSYGSGNSNPRYLFYGKNSNSCEFWCIVDEEAHVCPIHFAAPQHGQAHR